MNYINHYILKNYKNENEMWNTHWIDIKLLKIMI